jgi:dTMP kinase
MAHIFGIDGLNGAGKTTVLKIVGSELVSRGLKVQTVCFPGATPAGLGIRSMLLNGSIDIPPMPQFLLFAADNALTWAKQLDQYKDRDDVVVLCDRTHLSALAFQGGQGVSIDLMLQVYAAQSCKYDRIFILDVPLNVATLRLLQRGESLDRIEALTEATQRRIHAIWQSMREIPHSQPVAFINATTPAEIVAGEILTAIDRIISQEPKLSGVDYVDRGN